MSKLNKHGAKFKMHCQIVQKFIQTCEKSNSNVILKCNVQ